MVLNSSNTKAENGSIAITNHAPDTTIKIVQNGAEINSLLNPLIEEIVNKHSLTFSFSEKPKLAPDIEEKIEYNSVKIFAEEIRENSGYMVLVEEAINNLDDIRPNSKETFLWAIKRKYIKIRKDLFLKNSIDPNNIDARQELIASNADQILNAVTEEIASTSSHLKYPIELMHVARELIVFYGFINCQILEKPPA